MTFKNEQDPLYNYWSNIVYKLEQIKPEDNPDEIQNLKDDILENVEKLVDGYCETQIGKANQVELDVNVKITETKYKPETQFVISADSEYDIIYNLRERKNRRIHQPIYENDITISINHRHLPLEQKREIARVIEKALNSNFSL